MKRFTETTKWSNPWFQELSYQAKLLWFYIFDNCDNAGVWIVNKKLAEFQLGMTINWDATFKELSINIEFLSRDKLWIKSFISEQYRKLSQNCKGHDHIFELLNKHEIKIQWGPNGVPMGSRPHRHGVPKEEKVNKEKFKLPFESKEFSDAWDSWVSHRKDIKQPLTPTSMNRQIETFKQWGEAKSIEVINRSILSGYQGLFESKQKDNMRQIKPSHKGLEEEIPIKVIKV